MPLSVAVINRTKDRPQLLRRAILSVLAQSYPHWIHLIVNDGGCPASVDLLAREYRESYGNRLVVLHHTSSQGMQNAANTGIGKSKSDLLLIHDDDDSLHPDFLQKGVEYLEEKGNRDCLQGVVSQSVAINERMSEFGNPVEVSRTLNPSLESLSRKSEVTGNPFPSISFLYRRTVHEKLGMFNQQYNMLGDWDFHYRFINTYKIGILPETLAKHHWRVDSSNSLYLNAVKANPSEYLACQRLLQKDLRRKHQQKATPSLETLRSQGKTGFPPWEESSLEEEIKTPPGPTVSKRQIKKPKSPKPRKASDFGLRVPKIDQLLNHPEQSASPFPQNRLRKIARKSKLVTFDISDTCLLRTTRRPIDVFLLLAEEMKRRHWNGANIFPRARVLGERDARQKVPSGEVHLKDIYRAVTKYHPAWPDLSEELMQAEIELEKKCLYGCRPILELYRSIKESGQRVAFVSDMYLPSAVIHEILVREGFDADPLFLSAELKKNKGEGSLYDHVLNSYKIKGKDVLHLGDNSHSDIHQARARGMKVFHVTPESLPQSFYEASHKPPEFAPTRHISSVAAALGKKNRITNLTSDLWETLGYQVAGPLYFFFLQWVMRESLRGGSTNCTFFQGMGITFAKRST